MNISVEEDHIWALDESYGRKGSRINPMIYWVERNAFWLQLALVGTLVATAWFIRIIIVFREEIRDIYSISKEYINRLFSLWLKSINGKKNQLRTRCVYIAKSVKYNGEPQVRLELNELRVQPNKQTKPKKQSGGDFLQNASKPRTRIMIVDDVYGEIVGYQDSAGPSQQGKGSPVVRELKKLPLEPRKIPNNYRRGLESFDCVGVQPRHHDGKRVDTVLEENRVAERARNISKVGNRSVVNTTRAQSARSSRSMSRPSFKMTPEMIEMKEIVSEERGEELVHKLVQWSPFKNADLEETPV